MSEFHFSEKNIDTKEFKDSGQDNLDHVDVKMKASDQTPLEKADEIFNKLWSSEYSDENSQLKKFESNDTKDADFKTYDNGDKNKRISLEEADAIFERLCGNFENGEDVKENRSEEIAKNCPIEHGSWEGERGNSNWIPEADYVPLKSNPEGKTWGEILKEFNIDSIPFKDGEPDFSEISKGDVKIEPFSENRDDNFDRADIELAKQRGCSPEEVAKWRKENGYTWHECKDMETMQKVPSIIHNNVSHRGGISEAKNQKEEVR